MATEDSMNGTGSGTSDRLTPAQKLQEKHNADAAHRATIEDVVDEEDVAHPPPSVRTTSEAHVPTAQPIVEPVSEKLAGKQKATKEPDTAALNGESKVQSRLDTKSEELFPALGAGPRSKAPAAAASAWGAKRPSSVGIAGANGLNGRGPLSSSTTSSRASTPASGMLTDTAANATLKPVRGMPQNPTFPGKYTDRFEFAPGQLVPRDQLRKPIKDVLQGINKRSKATVTMKPGPGGALRFEGVGPFDDTRQALKDVAKEIGLKSKKSVPVPLSVRPHIIGKQGTVIKSISDRTGARIQIPKVDEPLHSQDNEDDDMTVDVTIEGDPLALALAQQEIDSIVNERTSTVNLRLRDIPAEYYPFIAGPRDSRIAALENNHQVKVQVPHFDGWSHQSPPQAPATGLPATFLPHPHNHIRISGDRLAAQAARAEIERHVNEELRRQITLSEIGIDRNRHQFVLSKGPESLQSLLEETGCAVILPPSTAETEMLAVIGPQDKIDQGIERILDLATSMHMHSIDVAKQHANAPIGPQAHARALIQYLQERQAIEQLEKQYDARIVLPRTSDQPLEVYSREGKNALRARSDLMNLINAHPPSRFRHIDVDPFYHQHVQQQTAQRLRDDFGVRLVLPEQAEESTQVFLVYEDLSPSGAAAYQLPRQRPSSAEVASFERGLQQAHDHILNLLQSQQDIGSRDLEVPSKYQEKIQKFVSQEQQSTPSALAAKLAFKSNNTSNSDVRLRGPQHTLDELIEKIAAFIVSEKQDELERGHITTVDYPQKFANYLIGRKGETINKYREEFDVDIKVNDGTVEIKGPKAKGEAAKSRILALAKKLEDEVTHPLTIAPNYHRELIGAKGSYVNRLQDRYNVRIQFPRSGPNTGDERSMADASSDAGGRNNRLNQAPNVVLVRGPRQGADKAREELLDLVQHLKDNSYSASVSVSQAQIPSLIGQGGREMDRIRMETGAKVDVPGSHEQADSSGRVQVLATGTKKQVEDAKRLLEQRVKSFDESVSKTLDVDKKYHKTLIGSGGTNIRKIVLEAGGPEDTQGRTRLVQFPRPESDSTTIAFEGNQAVVEKIMASIQAFVDERENQITEMVEVAPQKHRLLIGRGGETRRALESQFRVSIDVPRVTQQGDARSQVKLVGKAEDVAKAKAHIQELVKDQEGETVQVPRRLHQLISDQGRFFRRLNNDYKVKVDHAGQQPPMTRGGTPKPQTNGTPLPLITDEPHTLDSHSWDVVDQEKEDVEEGEIPWILRGSPENIERARAALQKALQRAQTQTQEQTAIGYLVLPDPSAYRFIIGTKGAQIDAIRRQTGCKIDVPKDQTKGKAIEIAGSRDGVEHAKDIILDVVENGGGGNRRES